MNCRDFRRLYAAYRDGTDPELHAEMDDHMEVCLRCAAYDRAITQGVSALREEVLIPSPGFAARLESRLADAQAEHPALAPRVPPFLATAALILLGALVLLTFRESVVVPTPAAAEQPIVVAEPKALPTPPFVVFVRKEK